MAKRLSHKEKGFVTDIVKGETGTQAALNHYDTESAKVASVIAAENLAKPRIREAIEEALPDSMLHQIHREGLFATKSIYNEEGEKIEDEADFANRAKYLDMAYKRKGSYAAEKHISLNIELVPSADLKKYAHALLGQQKTA